MRASEHFLALADQAAKEEVVIALASPAQKIVNLLHNRVQQLHWFETPEGQRVRWRQEIAEDAW